MISVVTAYYNRKELFKRTLYSIREQHSDALLEVIAVDDGSDEEERLEDLIEEFSFLRVIRLEKADKWYHNSCIPFNIGFRAAKGDKIIIQNPECLHYGNILNYTQHSLTQHNYLSFACFSLDKTTTDNLDQILDDKMIPEIIKENDQVITNDGDAGWYNHSEHRAAGYHFCTAVTKKNLNKLGGFDELYALGIAFDDDDLLSRIKKSGLSIEFINFPLALHQNHYSPESSSFQNRTYKNILLARNRSLFKRLNEKSYFKANKLSRYLQGNLKKYYLKTVLNILERV